MITRHIIKLEIQITQELVESPLTTKPPMHVIDVCIYLRKERAREGSTPKYCQQLPLGGERDGIFHILFAIVLNAKEKEIAEMKDRDYCGEVYINLRN